VVPDLTHERRMAMFRRCLIFGVLVAALLWPLGDPGLVQAQHGRGGFRPGGRPLIGRSFPDRFVPGFRPGFFRPTPPFRFDPRFAGVIFERRLDRIEDRLEDRVRRELLVDPRLRLGIFNPFFAPF
jgi:hypothetical protein